MIRIGRSDPPFSVYEDEASCFGIHIWDNTVSEQTLPWRSMLFKSITQSGA